MAKAMLAEEIAGGASSELIEAGDSMLMMVSGAMWQTLIIQGKAEGVAPGIVLDRAMRFYLEAHGSSEAVEYLWNLKRNQVR